MGSGSTAKIMVFSYDAQGRPFAVKYSANNGGSYITYFYALNQQGDVVKIFRSLPSRDSNGNLNGLTEAVYATYTYDAWGNILSQSGSMASTNPLRYRGYYYDSETGFYYLQSRYYDPATRRFINADVYSSTDSSDAVSCNMFAYCNNNPVIASDENGDFFFTIIGAVVGAAMGAIDAAIKHEDVLAGALGGAASGMVTGAAADILAVTGGTAAVAAGAMAFAGFAGTVAEHATKAAVTGEKIKLGEMITDALWNAGTGALFGYMGGDIPSKLAKVAKKGLGRVLVDSLKVGAKKWAGGIAEEGLSSITSGVGRFTVRVIKRMVTSIK